MLKFLLSLLRPRAKIAEEKVADEQFRAQIREAFLRGSDLQEAADQMKESRERKEAYSFRRPISSRPDPV